jgi:hypothetical protein
VDEIVRRYRLAAWGQVGGTLGAAGEAFRALVAVLSKLAATSEIESQKDLEERIASLLRGASPSDEIVRRLAAQLRGPPEE